MTLRHVGWKSITQGEGVFKTKINKSWQVLPRRAGDIPEETFRCNTHMNRMDTGLASPDQGMTGVHTAGAAGSQSRREKQTRAQIGVRDMGDEQRPG